ncbi:MAG TPA: hypothetical protein VM345_05670 [Acidimicrobiales bacterium]|jgi:hypothetical protein|nr:hypothetical protein [Acidimicrobiales bacterium]
MAQGIFVERDGQLVNMVSAPYAAEDVLQGLLERHAVLLAGDQLTPGSEPRRFVLVRREAGIPDSAGASDRWAIDHLFLDQDGVPTLVEVKRSTDSRIRREVVGQMLDYAANAVVYWPVERLIGDFNATHAAAGDGIDQLRDLLGLADTAPDDLSASVDAFWQQVESNLLAGRVRLLFVADELPDELRRIIEFLNQQMAPADVLGLEIRNYEGENLRALIPRVVGLTEAAKEHKRAGGGGSPAIEELWRIAATPVVQARELLDQWAGAEGLEQWDKGKSRRYAWAGARRALVLLYPLYEEVYFVVDCAKPPDKAEELRATLGEILGRQMSMQEPGIKCSTMVAKWQDVSSRFLTPLAAAAK